MNLLAIVASVVLVSTAAAASAAAAEPASAAQGETNAGWRLDVRFDPPRATTVARPGGPARVVWYSTFSVTNKTGAPRAISPFVSIVTDTGKTFPAAFDLPALQAVRLVAGEGLTDVYQLPATVDDGATLRGVAVFGDLDRFANRFELRARGFASGLGRRGGEWVHRVMEHRAHFHRPGNEHQALKYLVTARGDEWVTLEEKKIRG